MLRIDINLLFTVINVLILFVAVRLLLWKPIHKILAERQAQADAGMEQAAEKRAEAEALAAQHQLQLDSIAQERTAALEEARSQAQAESQRILAAPATRRKASWLRPSRMPSAAMTRSCTRPRKRSLRSS